MAKQLALPTSDHPVTVCVPLLARFFSKLKQFFNAQSPSSPSHHPDITVKNPKNMDPEKFAAIILKFEQCGFTMVKNPKKYGPPLGHIGVFLSEFSRKAIISQYCYSSLAAVNQDNRLGTYDPFRILQHLFFIQSDILEIRTEKSFRFCSELKLVLFSGHNANSVMYGPDDVYDCVRLQICAISNLDLPYLKLHYL